MKAAFKKAIAVAFVAVTAASMLSVGASAASTDVYTDTASATVSSGVSTYGLNSRWYYGDNIKVTMTADNYANGYVTVSVDVPSGAKIENIHYNWVNDGCSGLENKKDVPNSQSTSIQKKITASGTYFSAACQVTVKLSYDNGQFVYTSDPIEVSLKNKWSYESEASASQNPSKPYYDSNLNRQDYWDKDNIYYVDGVYYWYANGRWQSSKYWGDWDWDWDYRPSYSREYEVDWSGDTFEYNGKEQLPTATVTIGNKTIDLDVKLISGDGTSVGRHRVRASLPTRYRNYDITGTTLYYEIEEAQKEGFVTEGGKTYYYDNGRKVTGWQTIKGSDYYFLDNGEAADGWVKDGPADWYYFDEGKMVTGWINDGGTTYYCYNSGKMCHGRWHEIGNKWYYFNASGAMATSQWILDKGKWYYVAGDGVMATNTTVPGGYKVDKNGVWVK